MTVYKRASLTNRRSVLQEMVRMLERRVLHETLARHKSISAAASELGMAHSNIHRICRSLGYRPQPGEGLIPL